MRLTKRKLAAVLLVSPEMPPSAYPGNMKLQSTGAPLVVPQMLLPGLPKPCIAASATIVRAHSLPVAARQAPPMPPGPPAASMVFLAAHSRASARISRAGTADSRLGPLGRLRHAVGLAEHVGLPLVEADRAAGDVLLVVGALGQPGEGDGQPQGHVGARPGSEPLVAEQAGGVVEVGVDDDHLHAQFLEPAAPDGAFEGPVHPVAARFGVGRPVDHHLGVLERVLEQPVLLVDAQAEAVAPHVDGAPVPALPTVGVVLGVGAAHQVHEAEKALCR